MMSLTALAERAVSGAVAGEAGGDTARDIPGDTAGEENVERAFASAEDAELVEDAELLVLSDARRREVYSARYRVNAEGYSLVEGPNVCPASEFLPGGGSLPTPTATVLACTPRLSKSTAGPSLILPARFTPRQYLVAAAARLGVENLSKDTSAQYLRDSDAKVPAAMLARQQKQAAQAAAEAAAQKES